MCSFNLSENWITIGQCTVHAIKYERLKPGLKLFLWTRLSVLKFVVESIHKYIYVYIYIVLLLSSLAIFTTIPSLLGFSGCNHFI